MQSSSSEIIASIYKSHKKTSIADLELGEQSCGSYLLLRTIRPAFRMYAIHVFVADHLGNTINFCAYNYCSQMINCQMVFPVGTMLVLINPYKKLGATDGIPKLRCDDPKNILIVPKSFKRRSIPKVENSIVNLTSGESCKARGNELYIQKKYDLALDAYLAALKFTNSSDLNSLIYLNLAATYLALGYFESCLEYSLKVLKTIPGNNKALYRAGLAYYKLRQYAAAKYYFEKVIAEDSSNLEAVKETKECTKRLEEATGEVDTFDLFTRSQTRPKTRLDCADYVGPLEVVLGKGLGKGVFAKCDISSGTLLVVCKALEVDFTGDATRNNLFQQVAGAIQKNPKMFGKLFYYLSTHDLDYESKTFCVYKNVDISDTPADKGQIKKIVSRNYLPLLIRNKNHYEFVEKGTGLFMFISYFNHSCVPNAVWQTYNDILVIHAVQPILRGEEVRISFQTIKSDYLIRVKGIIARNFECECNLCNLDSQLPTETVSHLILKYEKLSKNSKFISERSSESNIKKIKQIIEKLEQIYKSFDRKSLQVPLARMYGRLATALLKGKHLPEAMKIVEKAFNSMGLNSRDILETVKRGENDVFPAGSGTFAYDLVIQLVVVVICANEVRGCLEEAREWLNVLVVLERVCTGGSLAMIKVKYTDIPANLF